MDKEEYEAETSMKNEENNSLGRLKSHFKQEFNELKKVSLAMDFYKPLLIKKALCTTHWYKAYGFSGILEVLLEQLNTAKPLIGFYK
jgi:hypothetical protein